MQDPYIAIAAPSEASIIHQLAHEIWFPTYADYLAEEQLTFMLNLRYAPEAITEQMQEGESFALVKQGKRSLGFAGYRLKSTDPSILRLEKLYVLPSTQGMGLGRLLVSHVIHEAEIRGLSAVELNVNRYNKNAVGFYEKYGFTVIAELDIPYYDYVLNDYVMRLPV